MALNYEVLSARLRVMSLDDVYEEYNRLRDPLLEDDEYSPEEINKILRMHKSELFRRAYSGE